MSREALWANFCQISNRLWPFAQLFYLFSACYKFFQNFSGTAVIESVVSKLENGHEISFSDPISGDCIREIRYSKKGYEMKLGCHGSSGTWKQSSKTEVIEWVNEVAKYNLRGKGIYSPASYSIKKS